MAEYIDNGVKTVNIGDQIRIGTNNTGYSPSMCAGVIFKKSGLYEVSFSRSGDYMIITNVTPQSKTCDGCKYYFDQRPNTPCLTCSRRCMDHYEKEEDE